MEQPGSTVIDHMRWLLSEVGTYHFKLGNEKAWMKGVSVHQAMKFEDQEGGKVDNVQMIK